MKRILQFLRTTLVGGILFLVPIVVLGIVLGQALALTHKLVDPLAEHLPFESVIGTFDKGWDQAAAKGWTVVSMKDDWKTISRPKRNESNSTQANRGNGGPRAVPARSG